MLECFRQGLFLRGILHDIDKFYPDEFFPYARYFGKGKFNILRGRNKTGYYTPDTREFKFAWTLHQKRSKHHWQWWTHLAEAGRMEVFEIPEPYITEMMCDWIGAGRAQGNYFKYDKWRASREWYHQNKKVMLLHKNTKKEIEKRIYYE